MTNALPLARIAPAAHPANPGLTRGQKAAIVVRFLLNEGADVRLDDLPEGQQAQLTTMMGSMRYVDRSTLAEVVAEFADELDAMGLTFPRGVAGALSALDGRISPQTAARLRKEAGVRQFGDPWEQIKNADLDALVPVMERESTEIAAVILAKLNVTRAAELLSKLPGPTARRITYAVSQTDAVSPTAVDRIGLSLAAELHDTPETAFDQGAVERVGAILNYSAALTRDDVLEGLEEADGVFAAKVRRAIFTFADIPARLAPTDVPKITRDIDQAQLVQALAAALCGDLIDVGVYLLDNMSKRMADSLREEVEELGSVKSKDAEAAMNAVVAAIRTVADRGEIALVNPDDESED